MIFRGFIWTGGGVICFGTPSFFNGDGVRDEVGDRDGREARETTVVLRRQQAML